MNDERSPSSARSSGRRLWCSITVLVVVWLVVILNRHTLMARYYGYRLTRASSPAEHARYFSKLAGLRDRAVGTAERMLDDADAGVRATGAAVLHHARSDRARRALLGALGDPDENVREIAVLGLAFHHDRRAVPALTRMLAKATEYPAFEAAVALERIGGDEAIDALMNASRTHPIRSVRAQAIDSLGRLEAARAVNMLIDLLADESPVRFESGTERAVRTALGRAGGELAKLGLDASALATRPSEENPRAKVRTIADVAARALRRITHESFGFHSSEPKERKQNAIRLWKNWSQRRKAA